MDIRRMDLKSLKDAKYNPRTALKDGDYEFERLKASIAEFGGVEPIVWNERTQTVVGGHQRIKALLALGETQADVSVVDLSETEEKLLNVALNKIKGDWDVDMLAEVLKQIDADDLSLTGFNPGEIAVLLSEDTDVIEELDEDDSDDPDDEEPHYDRAEQTSEYVSSQGYSGNSNRYEEEGSEGEEEDSVPQVQLNRGMNYVLALKFADFEAADAWCVARGWEGRCKATSRTTVVAYDD